MELDWQFFAIAGPAVIFAGISKAGFGSGAAFVAAAILALVLPPGMALGIMLPILMLIDVASLRPYWGKWHGPSALWLIVGGVPGVALGAFIYTLVDANFFRLLIGLMCLVFVVYQVARDRGWLNVAARPFNKGTATGAGVAVGFASFVSHAGGPPAAMFLLSQKLSKTTYQATTVIVFWAVNIMKFVPYAFLGLFTWETLMIDLMLVPFALLGTWLGVRAHRLVPERAFFILTYALLVVTGLRLIWVAL